LGGLIRVSQKKTKKKTKNKKKKKDREDSHQDSEKKTKIALIKHNPPKNQEAAGYE
jgi:hypothetical protein